VQLALDRKRLGEEVDELHHGFELALVQLTFRALVDLDADGDVVHVSGMKRSVHLEIGEAADRSIEVHHEMSPGSSRVHRPHLRHAFVPPRIRPEPWSDVLRDA
jgi:hypothetical protein